VRKLHLHSFTMPKGSGNDRMRYDTMKAKKNIPTPVKTKTINPALVNAHP
jgi:hypothetical protein